MSIEFLICISGIIALFVTRWKDRRANELKLNAFFYAMEDIYREDRKKLNSAIELIVKSIEEEKQ